ncbi:polysaccharide transporter, PST family [Salinimicrobium sediminis]|uniref:Polysaccharide transporter, PST family n=1 Tax=Salinimicrobium sediminis TaxID=1343891 RepID=A0A285X7E6_9FLAO|nr:lipopolysaccharide biosynthesis protein [Salinimicrobium sediminis]SOC80329.1 polysaccharide transporter, PST family [Salinimicrobium sediminis]
MLKGIFYTAIAKYSGVIISLVVGAVLARLLTPEEFGIVALVTVFVTFFNLLGNFGLGPAIVQRKHLTPGDIQSIFSFSLVMGVGLATAFFFSAGLIAGFYEEPELIPIVRILALSILFNIFRIVPSALLLKKLEFKQIGIIKTSVHLLSGLAAIVMAYYNFSYYALVYKSIIDGFLIFIIFFGMVPVIPVLNIRKKPLREIASFSTYQFGFNFINYFSRNLDNLLIGKYLGNANLGYYNKSYGLMMLPVGNLTNVITPVLHPVLSNYQHNKLFIFNTYLKLIKVLAMLGFPLSIFLYFAAPELILIIYGNQWGPSIPVFQILAFTVGFQVCLSSSGSIFQAVDRTDLLFLSGLLSAILMVSGIMYGVFIGGNIEAVGLGLVIAFVLNFFQGFFMVTHYALNQSFLLFLKTLIIPLIASLFAAVPLFLFDQNKLDSDILNLLIKSLIFGVFLVIFFLATPVTREFLFKKIRIKKK